MVSRLSRLTGLACEGQAGFYKEIIIFTHNNLK